MAFSRPPIQKIGIFETPLYKKIAFSRPPIQKNYLPPPSPFLNGIALRKEMVMLYIIN